MLTQKQEQFCLNLFQGLSQREAWVKAGYSSKYAPALIDSHACVLANQEKVKQRLAELRQKAEDAAITTVIQRKKILSQIETATIGDFVDQFGNLDVKKDKLASAAVAEIKTETTPIGYKTTLKLRDPIGAISEHNKMDGVYEDENKGKSNNVNVHTVIFNVINPDTKVLIERLEHGEREPMVTNGDIPQEPGSLSSGQAVNP